MTNRSRMSRFARRARLVAGLAVVTVAGAALAAPPATVAQQQPAKAGGARALGDLGSSREPISIDADRLDVYDKEGRAVFTGNVVAIQGDTNMKCTVMNVFYENTRRGGGDASPGGASPAPATGSQTPVAAAGSPKAAAPSGGGSLANDSAIKKIDCKGPVVIKTKTQTATGDRAEFDRVVNKVFLIGNAVLSDGPNVTRGERVAYDLTSGVANVEGGRVRALIVPGSDKPGDKKKPARPSSSGTDGAARTQ